MKGRKDKDIERILRSYADGSAKPAAHVTAAAKNEMRASAAQAVPVAAGASSHGSASDMPQSAPQWKTIAVLAAAALLLTLTVGLFLWRLEGAALPGALLLADGKTYVSESGLYQSKHSDGDAVSPACLPWVEDDEIVCYREYALLSQGRIPSENAETVVYRIEYCADGVSATVFVEKKNVRMVALSDFKHLPDARVCGDTEFHLQTHLYYADVYFETNAYNYNLRLETGEDETLTAALTAIGESL